MARDIFILGEIGSGTEIELPEVLEFSETPLVRVDAESFDENRPGGYATPRRFGSSRVSLECMLYVDVVDDDALDIAYGEFKSAIEQKLRFGSQKLWTAEEWFHNVVLDSDAFQERGRDFAKVTFSLNFICLEGRRFFMNEVTQAVNTGVATTFVSPSSPPLYIEFNTTIGQTYTIVNNFSPGIIKVNALVTGLIRIHVEENRATRAGVYVDSEIEGVFPDFPVNAAVVVTMTNVATVNFKFRKAIVA